MLISCVYGNELSGSLKVSVYLWHMSNRWLVRLLSQFFEAYKLAVSVANTVLTLSCNLVKFIPNHLQMWVILQVNMFVFQCIYGCYVHSAILPTFHRRCYWLLQVKSLITFKLLWMLIVGPANNYSGCAMIFVVFCFIGQEEFRPMFSVHW